MGCAPTKKQFPLTRKQTLVGVLRVTVLGVYTHQQVIDPQAQLRLRVSNQTHATTNLPPLAENTRAGDTFAFFINSFYKPLGRTIDIAYFLAEDMRAHGVIDADPFIQSKANTDFRCILADNKQTEFGFVQLRAAFEVLPVHSITFRFESATIRRKRTGCCGSQQVAVRLTIAEQQLETEFQQDTPNKPPVWQDRKYNFKVPDGVVWGQLELIDEQEQVVGAADVNLAEVYKMKEGDEVLQTQELFFEENKQRVVAADIKYTFMLGNTPNFQPRSQLFTSAIRGIRTKDALQQTPP